MLFRGLVAKVVITTFLFVISTASFAAGLDINLNDEAVQVRYTTSVGGSTYGRSELLTGVLYNEKSEITLGEFGLMVIDVAGSKAPGLEVGVGPKLIVLDTNNGNAMGLSLGGRLRYKSGQQSRMFVRGQLFYAPAVVSSGDAENYTEMVFEVGFELLPTADIYFGYRNIDADFEGTSRSNIEESGYFGMKIDF